MTTLVSILIACLICENISGDSSSSITRNILYSCNLFCSSGT